MSSKTVLITGGSSKLGQTFAEYMQSQNYRIYYHYNTSLSKIQYLSEEKNIFIAADFNNINEAIERFEEIFEKHGYPDIIINNASSFYNDKFGNLDVQTFQHNLNVNAITPLFLLSTIAEKMPKESLIINILDYFTTKIPTRNFLSYGIAKAMFANLTEALAVIMAPKTRVNGIAISPVLCGTSEAPNDFIVRATDNPLSIKTEVKHILNTLDYIIKNNCITGEIIRLDSGKHLQMKSDYFNN